MQWESVTYLKIDDLVDFEAQPFKVIDDDAMHELVDSIKTVGAFVLFCLSNVFLVFTGRNTVFCLKVRVKEIRF